MPESNLLLDMLDEFEDLPASAVRRNPGSAKTPSEYLAFVQGSGVDLQSFGAAEWAEVADAMGLRDLEREKFLEDVAGWL